jgi:multidrug efflux pump subunit AcrB
MLLVSGLGILAYFRTPTDILPTLKVPVVVVFASYRGMPAPDMEQTVTAILERALTKCDHLERIESRSLLGISIIQVYFRPNVSGDIASSQVISLVNGEMQNLPPGMLPPTILNYDASAIPVGNLVLSSETRDDKFLLDLADSRLREELAGIEGLSAAPVFGGVFRQVQIYVHPRSLEALNMSPLDVARIVNSQSAVIPTGEIRIDKQNYYVRSNAMIQTPEDFGEVPLYNDGRKIVKLKDVAEVVDGTRWRTNIVRVNGRRAVYMPLLRQAGASAVTVVDNVRDSLEDLKQRGAVPDDVTVEVAFDQSVYVRDALANLRSEAVLGGVLASLVVLLFLGSLRCTLIVALSIPLSLLAAFAGLYFTGETLNIMTLGGLALVLGRVVDDCVVDVENTVRHVAMGKTPYQAALDSAKEISVPILMATLVTVVVFLPLVLTTGMAKYLFTPLAVSVALAMGASYIVSRTVSPLLSSRCLIPPLPGQGHQTGEKFPRWLLIAGMLLALGGMPVFAYNQWVGPIEFPTATDQLFGTAALLGWVGVIILAAALLLRWSPSFDHLFEMFTRMYAATLHVALRYRLLMLLGLGFLLVPTYFTFRQIGQELFPDVDSSEFTLHVRATGGPRVEETERQVEEMEKLLAGYRATAEQLVTEVQRAKQFGEQDRLQAIREANSEHEEVIDEILAGAKVVATGTYEIPGLVPPEDLRLMLSNIGMSSRWSAIYTPNNGPHAAFLRVGLRSGFAGRHMPTREYVDNAREYLKRRFPTHDLYFETGGMIRRILNNGAVAPIEVQVSGRDFEQRRRITELLHKEISQLASVHDAQSPQGIDLPQLRIVVDRIKAAQPGLTEADVIRNVITALMSSAQLAPNLWIDPKNGNPYIIGVQYPEYAVQGIRTLEEIPITAGRIGRDAYMRSGPGSTRGSQGQRAVRLEDVATIERGMGPVEVYHYGAARANQLFVSVADSDLAGVAGEIQYILRRFPLSFALDSLPRGSKHLVADVAFRDKLERYVRERDEVAAAPLGEELKAEYKLDPKLLRMPRDTQLTMRGEVVSMRKSFGEMGTSLLLAVFLVYLVMVAQFASWLDPLIMIVSAPLGLIGVGFMLWLTGTSLNIQSAMGVLMMIGISVSNSVLMVEFANRQKSSGMSNYDAILSASCVRLRPVLMTTIATLAGLAPLAIHRHPGDEMNLPLARAVIGGLAGSTLLTLFIVPVLYTLVHRDPPTPAPGEGPTLPGPFVGEAHA